MAMKRKYEIGQAVVVRLTKRSASPGPRAENVQPEPLGEDYSYEVDKYWVIQEIRPDGQLVLRTRRGKMHVLPPNHPTLRRPNLWERLLMKRKFPRLEELPAVAKPKRADS